MTNQVSVAIAFHSGFGHTARQAAAAAEGADTVGRATLHDVSVLTDDLWAALAAADAIIFGSPTYMGSPSAVFQAFAEATSPIWAESGWRGKLAAGFTNSAGVNGDKLNALTSMTVFAAQHGMIWVPLGLPPGWLFRSTGKADELNRLGGFLGAMAQSPSDLGPQDAPHDADLRTAAYLGARVGAAALEVATGRRALAARAA